MKSIRDTGMGIPFNRWAAMCKKAQRTMRKNGHYDYNYLDMTLPRYRARKCILLALRKRNHKLYWHTRHRLYCKYDKIVWGCK